MKVASLLINDDTITSSDAFAVEVFMFGELFFFFGFWIVGPNVGCVVPFRQIVNNSVEPYRREVTFAFPGSRFPFPIFGRNDADRLGLAATIVSPFRVPQTDLLIRNPFSIVAHLSVISLWQIQCLRQSTVL